MRPTNSLRSDTKTQVGSNAPSLDDSFSNYGDHSGDDDIDALGGGALSVEDRARAALDEALDDLTERKKNTRFAALRELQKGMLKAIPVDFLVNRCVRVSFFSGNFRASTERTY